MESSSQCVATPTVRLNDGHKMPMVGLGTYMDTLSGSDELTKTTVDAVKSAIDVGYRHIDTAFVYATERGVGQAIIEKIQEGVIKREDIFVTTKLWNTDHRRAVSALRQSLSLLQLDYVDMYLVHWPMAFQGSGGILPLDENGDIICDNEWNITDTWKGMEECKKLGLTRSIGVSNFNHLQLQRVLDICSIKPANNQIEVHPFLANKRLIEFCQSEDIMVTAYCPLGRPKSAQPDGPSITTNTTINRIAKQHNKELCQVSLKFLIQRGIVVIPKSVNPQHQRQNLDIFDCELTQKDLEALYDCNKNFRNFYLPEWGHSSEWPFHEEW